MSTANYTALFANLLGSIPETPNGWGASYLKRAQERVDTRARTLPGRIDALALGRVVPDPEDLSIGSGRHLSLAVLFLDICQFSSWPSASHAEQSQTLMRLNVFMAEMLNIIRDYGGHFEKNTGDGLMAYFGSGSSELLEASRSALYCGSVMQAVNQYVLTPWFQKNGLDVVRFRVGIDVGEVTIARIGIHGLATQRVAIGSTANIACKIMKFVPDGGISIGDSVKQQLSANWQRTLEELPATGFVYVKSQAAYKAWKVDHTLSYPIF